MQDKGTNTIGHYFMALRMIHVFISAGLVLVAAVIYYMHMDHISDLSPEEETKNLFTLALLSLIAIMIGKNIFKRGLLKCKADVSLSEALHRYRKLIVFRFAVLELASLGILLVYYFTAQTNVLWIFGVIVIHLGLLRPSRESLIQDLELSEDKNRLIYDDEHMLN